VLAANLVSKGLTGRPKTVARAADALMLLFELDAAEATQARATQRLWPPPARLLPQCPHLACAAPRAARWQALAAMTARCCTHRRARRAQPGRACAHGGA
jgi:hypothetical protein